MLFGEFNTQRAKNRIKTRVYKDFCTVENKAGEYAAA